MYWLLLVEVWWKDIFVNVTTYSKNNALDTGNMQNDNIKDLLLTGKDDDLSADKNIHNKIKSLPIEIFENNNSKSVECHSV